MFSVFCKKVSKLSRFVFNLGWPIFGFVLFILAIPVLLVLGFFMALYQEWKDFE